GGAGGGAMSGFQTARRGVGTVLPARGAGRGLFRLPALHPKDSARRGNRGGHPRRSGGGAALSRPRVQSAAAASDGGDGHRFSPTRPAGGRGGHPPPVERARAARKPAGARFSETERSLPRPRGGGAHGTRRLSGPRR